MATARTDLVEPPQPFYSMVSWGRTGARYCRRRRGTVRATAGDKTFTRNPRRPETGNEGVAPRPCNDDHTRSVNESVKTAGGTREPIPPLFLLFCGQLARLRPLVVMRGYSSRAPPNRGAARTNSATANRVRGETRQLGHVFGQAWVVRVWRTAFFVVPRRRISEPILLQNTARIS